MDYEKKYKESHYEKKYKESLKVAKEIHKFSSDIAEIKRMEQIFPELVESEEKKIKSKPKFKAGDWITNGACIIQITSVDDRYYWHDNDCVGGDIESIDKEYHLWTIDDAKEGDVLAYVTDEEDLWIMIYWSLYAPYEGHVHYHALLVNDNFSDKGTCCICINDLKPATKEQRDVLFAKMKEDGYTFDFEKKELKKIKSQPSKWNISDFRTWQYIVSDVLTKYDGIGQYLDDGFCRKIAQHMQEEWSKKLSF